MSYLIHYAERLAKAMPERFILRRLIGSIRWDLLDKTTPSGRDDLNALADEHDAWAFFGPLADEFGVREVKISDTSEQGDGESLLEALAAAVCEAAEAKAKKNGE